MKDKEAGNFSDCPLTTAEMRYGRECKPHHLYTTADFSDRLERQITRLLSERQALREALEAALTVIHHTPACDKHLTEQCICGAASACLTISAALSLADKPL